MAKEKYSYYPGCSLESTAKEYDSSIRSTSRLLGLDIVELEDWSCCGASSGHYTNHKLALSLPARNLAIAEKEGRQMAIACAACFLRFKQANHELTKNDSLREEISEIIGEPYKGTVQIRHFIDIFKNDIGLDEIKSKIKKPLTGLKAAAYYGCYLVRPPEVTELDDPENPMIIDDLLSAAGAEPINWSHKVDCCGGNLMLSRTDMVYKLVDKICHAAKESGADVIVTACPLCEVNLDTRQPDPVKIPIVQFSELLGLALGEDMKTVKSWWKRHIVNPETALKQHSLV